MAQRVVAGGPRLRGFFAGLGIGAVLWAIYFLKVNDWAFWTNSVLPAAAVIAAAAFLLGWRRGRRFNFALGVGTLASVPLVIGGLAAYLLLTIGTLD